MSISSTKKNSSSTASKDVFILDAGYDNLGFLIFSVESAAVLGIALPFEKTQQYSESPHPPSGGQNLLAATSFLTALRCRPSDR